MSPEPLERFPDTNGFAAYDRQSVERFFLEAFEARGRLLGQTAAARRRIAVAEAVLANASDDEFRSVRTVLEGQSFLRDEIRANERAVAAVAENAEAEAGRILAAARARVATNRATDRLNGRAEADGGPRPVKRHAGRTSTHSPWPSSGRF